MKKICLGAMLSVLSFVSFSQSKMPTGMHLNSQEYLEYEGVNVMLAHDFYPEGHQGGIGIIQHGMRVATNGDIRLEATPGQWQPIPKVGKRVIDAATQRISVRMEYPNEAINRKGFNPIIYPDLHFSYEVSVVPEGKGFHIYVDLDQPLPDEWIGKVGFNVELYPGILFGKSYLMDGRAGSFPRQVNGPFTVDAEGKEEGMPLASGKTLVIAPESATQRLAIENKKGDPLILYDGRARHNNGWFVVRSLVPRGATKHAIEWWVLPHAIPGWKSEPVIQVSQVGYHPAQKKVAVIEMDAKDKRRLPVSLLRINGKGEAQKVLEKPPVSWGQFLRYDYLQFDFSSVKEPGLYEIQFGSYKTHPFRIGKEIFQRDVWQPTLEYFLPVQMCHMRINDKYRVWHGWCHLDDARMAPVDSNHFDGYLQGPSTLTKFRSGQTVPGLNRGGWHDAGDFDLRVESQAETVYGLSLGYELFDIGYDNTTIDQQRLLVEIHQPDGKPDVLQQVEHGLLSIIGGYRSMGRFYRGIICPTLRQYVLLGDAANMTDNTFYHPSSPDASLPVGLPGSPDDRWVFTEENPGRSLQTAAALAAASRTMKGYNDSLSRLCLQIAVEVWRDTKENNKLQRLSLAVELLKTTGEKQYQDFLIANAADISKNIMRYGWQAARSLALVKDTAYQRIIIDGLKFLAGRIKEDGTKTPYGVPYQPNIWGAGWNIQNFGYRHYFLHTARPDLFPKEYLLDALDFILGRHPGPNTASFASGVGVRSAIPGYGLNRADWSYIPGGIASGTALIRPDFPELLEWPFLWQQTEYVLGGGTTDYLFLVWAADKLLNSE